MMGPTHRLLGASTGLAVAQVLGWSPGQAVAATLLAVATAGGRFSSPDMDQGRVWRFARRHAPIGWRRAMGHRQITHWWRLPVGAWLIGALACWLLAAPLWPLDALVAGWSSHLVGDWVFGRRDRYTGRGPGIPIRRLTDCHGCGLKVGGRTEMITAVILLPLVIAAQIAFAIGHTG